MSNQENDKGDPASRLAEMLAQSLDELARPASDKPLKVAEAPPAQPAVIEIALAKGEEPKLPKTGPAPELEAWFEQFQKKVQNEPAVSLPKVETKEPEPRKEETRDDASRLEGRVMEGPPPAPPPPDADNDDDILEPAPIVPAAAASAASATAAPQEAPLDPEAARLVRKVRRLMMVSMLITFIGVGSVFGVIGYRIYKNDGIGGKLFDPKPTAPVAAAPVAPQEKTLKLPPNARILAAGVAENRLVLTLELDGKIEMRTYDPRTLEPAARLGFAAAP